MRCCLFSCCLCCFLVLFFFFFFFFFQAEDGIRDWSVTGVQTCALPISCPALRSCDKRTIHQTCALYPRSQEGSLTAHLVRKAHESPRKRESQSSSRDALAACSGSRARSEERRVGKEWRSRWSSVNEKKT